MNTSVAWINDYLDSPVSAEKQADLLTRAGFPTEHAETVSLPDGSTDVRQDIEITSNRGDCLSHVGLAREIAAMSGHKLKEPQPKPKATGPSAASLISVTNREHRACPLYTARVIKGVKVGPSPAWLANRLLARGDIPRNNIVDASNFVQFELGQPTHAFDFAKVKGSKIIIRKAAAGEQFLPLGEGAVELKLHADDLVIADAERPIALAGVKGGGLSAVTVSTTDLIIEAATFAPASVRAASRRHGIASDSSFRFERGVSAGQIHEAADRLVELILQVAGGTLCEGVVVDGAPITNRAQLSLRGDRCRAILGVPVTDDQVTEALDRLGFEPRLMNGVVHVTVPVQRLDITREIDLIEEVGRMYGLEKIPQAESIAIRVTAPQPTELARRAVNQTLVGLGFVETVTHSLINEAAAAAFLPPDLQALRVADERAKAEPVLRPSILPSLLRVLAFNRDNGNHDVRLFESASTFAMLGSQHLEQVNVAIMLPAADAEAGMREMRGVIDRLAQLLLGDAGEVLVEELNRFPWFSSGASLRVQGKMLGTMGVLAPKTLSLFGLNQTVVAAEVGLPQFYGSYPPETESRPLPSFPAIERDVSAVVQDRLRWIEVKSALNLLKLQHIEGVDFVTTYRGKQIGVGRKSLTLRLRFCADDRTLKHEEVDVQMEQVMETLKTRFKAEIRS